MRCILMTEAVTVSNVIAIEALVSGNENTDTHTDMVSVIFCKVFQKAYL